MNDKITIGIIGYGYVGKAMAEFFKNHYKIMIYDTGFTQNSYNKEDINSNVHQSRDRLRC